MKKVYSTGCKGKLRVIFRLDFRERVLFDQDIKSGWFLINVQKEIT